MTSTTSSSYDSSSTYYSSKLSSTIVPITWIDDDDPKSSSFICQVPNVPYLLIPLSDRDEEVLFVQNLPTNIEPNCKISETVDKAIARYSERIDRQFEDIENNFKSINEEIERKIFNASQELDTELKSIDHSLSYILNDKNVDTYMQFDIARSIFILVNRLINERNQNINDFMDVLQILEKRRTNLIEHCYKRYMIDNKELPSDSFQRLYKKYLKNYNTVKLGNFRTYENLKFKLVQLNESYRQDFAFRTNEVKLKTKRNIAISFKNKLIDDAKMIMSDKISNSQTKSINFLNDLIELYNKLTQLSKEKINITFVLQCIDLSKRYSKKLDEIISSIKPLHDEVFEEIRLLSTKTIEDYDKTIMNSGEYLGPVELIPTNMEILTEANHIQQEKIRTILEVQLFLSNVKKSIKVVDMVFHPSVEIIYEHSERLLKTKNMVLVALENLMKINDIKLDIFENSFNIELNRLVQASDTRSVKLFEKKCNYILAYIINRIQFNKDGEMEILSSYKDLIKYELEIVRAEFQVIHNIYPNSLNPIPEFDVATQYNLWTKSINRSITSFKKNAKTYRNTIYKQLSTLILELKSKNILTNQFEWISFIKKCINKRFNVGVQLHELRTIRVKDGIVKKRSNEIEQHRGLLKRHIKAAQEKCESLKYKTKTLYQIFDLKKNTFIKNVEDIGINVINLSIIELSDVINKLKNQVHSVAIEQNNIYKSHYENVKLGFRKIEDSTLNFMKSIRIFPEGGNYGDIEAIHVANILNNLSNKIVEMKTDIIVMLKQYNSESVYEIEKCLLKQIKSLEVELEKKVLTQKFFSINKLMVVTVNQEILNLDNNMAYLRDKLHNIEKTFKNNNVVESSKSWSKLLSETKVFMNFLLESHNDLKALEKSDSKNSVWNINNLKDYIEIVIAPKSRNLTDKTNNFTFYDYSQIIASSKPVKSPTFLNNIYMLISHYLAESQINAVDMAMIDSMNSWITAKPEPTEIYHEIMLEAIKKSKESILQSELVWIFKLTDFLKFLNDFYVMEAKFKNIVLITYHEESMKILDKLFGAYEDERKKVRIHLKDICDKFQYRLKPSHGHPHNVRLLEDLIADFLQIQFECWNFLSNTYLPIKVSKRCRRFQQ